MSGIANENDQQNILHRILYNLFIIITQTLTFVLVISVVTLLSYGSFAVLKEWTSLTIEPFLQINTFFCLLTIGTIVGYYSMREVKLFSALCIKKNKNDPKWLKLVPKCVLVGFLILVIICLFNKFSQRLCLSAEMNNGVGLWDHLLSGNEIVTNCVLYFVLSFSIAYYSSLFLVQEGSDKEIALVPDTEFQEIISWSNFKTFVFLYIIQVLVTCLVSMPILLCSILALLFDLDADATFFSFLILGAIIGYFCSIGEKRPPFPTMRTRPLQQKINLVARTSFLNVLFLAIPFWFFEIDQLHPSKEQCKTGEIIIRESTSFIFFCINCSIVALYFTKLLCLSCSAVRAARYSSQHQHIGRLNLKGERVFMDGDEEFNLVELPIVLDPMNYKFPKAGPDQFKQQQLKKKNEDLRNANAQHFSETIENRNVKFEKTHKVNLYTPFESENTDQGESDSSESSKSTSGTYSVRSAFEKIKMNLSFWKNVRKNNKVGLLEDPHHDPEVNNSNEIRGIMKSPSSFPKRPLASGTKKKSPTIKFSSPQFY